MKWLIVVVLGILAAALAEDHPTPDKIPLDNAYQWIGRWKTTGRHEHFDDFMRAIGLPNHDVHNPETTHVLWREGDKFHHKISAPSVHYKKHLCFKLGELGNSSYNGTAFTYKYTELANKDLEMENKLPTYNKTITSIFHAEGNELMKTFKVDQVVAKRWYARVEQTAV